MANVKIVERKKQAVKSLVEEIKKAEIVLLTNYRGITVEEDTKLRKNVRENGGSYKVIKNNIAKRAFEELKIDFDDEVFINPTAIIIANENYLSTLKTIYKFSKDNEYYVIKAGTIEGEVKTIEELQTLAKLPSRQELMGMLAGTLLSTISKLAVAVNEVKNKKEETNDEKVEEVKENKEEKEEEKEEEKTKSEEK